MRSPLLVTVLLLLPAATGVLTAQGRNHCDKYVGVWEYVPPSITGRAVISRYGNGRYAMVAINSARARGTTSPSTDAERANAYATASAFAAEISCGPRRDTFRIVYSTNPAGVGTEFQLETEATASGLRWWTVGPDGRRGEAGAARRLR